MLNCARNLFLKRVGVTASTVALSYTLFLQHVDKKSSPATEHKTVPLAYTRHQPWGNKKHTIVLIHGLDSAKDTWSSVMPKLRHNSIAIDLRGHGESPLGDENEFGPQTLVHDVRRCVEENNIKKPFVLVGHSMGGRVVMRYAAEFPSDISELVVEDIDTLPRNIPDLNDHDLQKRRNFNRKFSTMEQCENDLLNFGYTKDRIDGWKKFGRILKMSDGTFWSCINPMAQYLALKTVLATFDGVDAWKKLDGINDMPVHLWVAGKGSACSLNGGYGLEGMISTLPRAKVHRFTTASHSIHNTDQEGFVDILNSIADKYAE